MDHIECNRFEPNIIKGKKIINNKIRERIVRQILCVFFGQKFLPIDEKLLDECLTRVSSTTRTVMNEWNADGVAIMFGLH